MPESKLDSIKAELSEELIRMNQNVKTLRKGLARAESERDKVKDVLDMLGGGKKKAKKEAAVANKKTADGDHVLQTMTTILDESGSLSRVELLELLKDKLSSEGYALTGLKQRFASLCDYPRFEVSGMKISLGEKATA